MSRRDSSTLQTPEIEASHLELSVIEGRKNTVLNETLSIAENKKQLEKDIVDSRERLEKEYEDKKKGIEADLLKLETRQKKAEVDTKQAEDSARLSGDKVDEMRKEIEALVPVVWGLQQQKDSLSIEIVSLTKEIKEGKSFLETLTSSVTELDKKGASLSETILGLEKRKTDLETKHVEIINNRNETSDSVNSLRVERKALEDKIAEILSLIAEKRGELSTINEEINKVTGQVAEHKLAMQKRENEANERLKKATDLELFVNDKLERLKELESHFTSEHVARHGYKKTS